MSLKLTAAAIAILMLGACASNPSQNGDNKTAQNDRVCVRQEVTGSHLGSKVCMTKEQQDARRKKAQDVMERETMGRGRFKSGGGK